MTDDSKSETVNISDSIHACDSATVSHIKEALAAESLTTTHLHHQMLKAASSINAQAPAVQPTSEAPQSPSRSADQK
jgi:hypothetical protein